MEHVEHGESYHIWQVSYTSDRRIKVQYWTPTLDNTEESHPHGSVHVRKVPDATSMGQMAGVESVMYAHGVQLPDLEDIDISKMHPIAYYPQESCPHCTHIFLVVLLLWYAPCSCVAH